MTASLTLDTSIPKSTVGHVRTANVESLCILPVAIPYSNAPAEPTLALLLSSRQWALAVILISA